MSVESLGDPSEISFHLSNIEARWSSIPEYKIDQDRFKHLGIICDGNRSYAKEYGLPPFVGHKLGLEVIRGIMRAANEWGVPSLTVWVWSTENWKRQDEQVTYIMDLAAESLADRNLLEELMARNVRFTHIGRKDRLSNSILENITALELQTIGNTKSHFNLALDYGGLSELAMAVAKIVADVQAGNITSEQLMQNPELIRLYVQAPFLPPLDLIVRTGMSFGEMPRTSGFMPLSDYGCWDFVPVLFPSLGPQDLLSSIEKFMGYTRRVGS